MPFPPVDMFLLMSEKGTVDFGCARVTWRVDRGKMGSSYAPCLVLEKIGVDDGARGQRICSEIIDYMERCAVSAKRRFVVEDVLSRKLMAMLQNRGYVRIPGTLPMATSMLKVP